MIKDIIIGTMVVMYFVMFLFITHPQDPEIQYKTIKSVETKIINVSPEITYAECIRLFDNIEQEYQMMEAWRQNGKSE